MAMRVQLPDEPNTLGRIAGALGDLGANIVHIDVHELDGTDVVDEIVITGPAALTPGEVRVALMAAGARSVVSVPLAYRQMDALVRSLTALLAVIPDVVPVESATIQRIDDLDDVDPAGRQLRWGTPAARCVDRSWLLAVPRVDRTPTPYDALVVRRSVRFSATEVARLRALLLLHAHLVTASGDAVATSGR